jgi:hypothetical protein
MTMKVPPSIIPKFVKDLNALGQQMGFAVTVGFAPVLDEEFPRQGIVSTWRGPRLAFLCFPDFVRRGVEKVDDRMVWPNGSDGRHPVIYGIVTRLGDQVEIQMSGGEVPISIEKNGDVEIIEYATETAYHGQFKTLFSRGYAIPDQFPQRGEWARSNEEDTDNGRWAAIQWSTTRCFDPRIDPCYIHRVETQNARENRVSTYLLADDPDELDAIWQGLANQNESAQNNRRIPESRTG